LKRPRQKSVVNKTSLTGIAAAGLLKLTAFPRRHLFPCPNSWYIAHPAQDEASASRLGASMKKWRLALLIAVLCIGSLAGLRLFVFPPRQVNYVNYYLVRPGMTYDDVVDILGPCFNEGRIADETGQLVILRDEAAKLGVHTVDWGDKPGILAYYRVRVQFRDGRVENVTWWQPSF